MIALLLSVMLFGIPSPAACAKGTRAIFMRSADVPTARVRADTVTITPRDTGMVRVEPDSQHFEEAMTEPNQPPDGAPFCARVSPTYRLKIAPRVTLLSQPLAMALPIAPEVPAAPSS